MTSPGGIPDAGPNPCPCLLCPADCTKHVNDNRRVCQPCRNRLRDDLHEIVTLYALLGEEMGVRTRKGGPRVSGSRDAPVPDLDLLNLRGYGARGNVHFAIDPATGRLDLGKSDPDTGLLPESDQHGPVPVFVLLAEWAQDWRQARGLARPVARPNIESALAQVVRFLDVHLDWACDHHPAIIDFAGELRQAGQTMRAARGDTPDTVYVGDCPTQVGTVVCGAPLYASTWRDVIRCGRCGVRRERSEWELLGKIMRGRGGAA